MSCVSKSKKHLTLIGSASLNKCAIESSYFITVN